MTDPEGGRSAVHGRVPVSRQRAVRALLWLLRNGLAVMAGLALTFVAFNYAIMPRLVRQGQQIQVPDVTGMTLAEAADALAMSQLAVRDTVERTSGGIAAGMVIDQEPGAGRTVKPDRRLRLIISAGGQERAVPEMNGQTLRFARLSLGQDGYVLGDVVRIPTSEVAADFVLGSDPPAGTALSPGQAVSLLVSTAEEGDAWVMPDLRGRRLTRVEDELKLAGFDVRVSIRDDNRFGWSLEVVQLAPPPGSIVHRGDVIQLIGG